jgi:hypothetical protein
MSNQTPPEPPIEYPKCPHCGQDLDAVIIVAGRERVHSAASAFNPQLKKYVLSHGRGAKIVSVSCYYCEVVLEDFDEYIYTGEKNGKDSD